MIKVLLIASGESLNITIREALDDNQFLLFHAQSGFEGIKKAKSIRPQVYLCEEQLGEMSAKDIFSKLEILGLLTFNPFIMISSGSQQVDMPEASAILALDQVKGTVSERILEVIEDESDHLDELNQIQHELNELETNNLLSDESLADARKQLILVQKLFPFIRMGRLALSYANDLLESSENIDEKVLEVNRAINGFRYGDDHSDGGRLKVNKIWLIDDDPAQNLINKMVLKQINSNIIISEFNDSGRAFLALQKERPDLILLDINMPKMNGFDFLAKLKDEGIGTHVIMLSSSLSIDEIKRSLGFEQVLDYFTKPIDRARVKRLMK